MNSGFRLCKSMNSWIVSHQSGKLPLSWKFRVDNFDCHAITITEKRLETSEFFSFKVVYHDLPNSNPMSIFIYLNRETSIIRKNLFFRIIENIRCAGRVSLKHAAMGLSRRLRHFTSSHAACNRCYRAAQSFALVWKKLINSTLFAGGGNKYIRINL